MMAREVWRDGRLDALASREVYNLISEALRALRPYAEIDAPTFELTIGQQAYAEALAWRGIIVAKSYADGVGFPGEAEGEGDGYEEMGPVDLTAPRCYFRVNNEPMPRFPNAERDRGNLASVVLRLQVDASGEVVNRTIAALVGQDTFSRAVERAAAHWTVTKREDSPANCRIASTFLVSIPFIIRP